jgi:hypothetical protein
MDLSSMLLSLLAPLGPWGYLLSFAIPFLVHYLGYKVPLISPANPTPVPVPVPPQPVPSDPRPLDLLPLLVRIFGPRSKQPVSLVTAEDDEAEQVKKVLAALMTDVNSKQPPRTV